MAFDALSYLDLLRFGLRVENLKHCIQNFIRVKNGMIQLEVAFSELSEIKQILNKRLHECKLAHGQRHVSSHVGVYDILLLQVLQNLCQEKQDRSDRGSHLV